jgi:hypothetical protein
METKEPQRLCHPEARFAVRRQGVPAKDRHVVAQGQRRLGVDRSQRRIGPALVFLDASLILHRGVYQGNHKHLLGPVVGWRVAQGTITLFNLAWPFVKR